MYKQKPNTKAYVYRSIFEKEPKEFVEERIVKSRLPLKRVTGQILDDVKYYSELLNIPIRPEWDQTTSKEQLEFNEKNLF